MQSRLQNCLDALWWVFNTARELNIKDVVFAGDLFQDRNKINVLTYHQTFKVFKQFPDLNIWLLLGNHDLWYSEKTDISSVIPFGAISYVNVIDKPCTLEVAGINIDFLPFTHNPISVLEENFQNKSKILVGHIAVDGALLNFNHRTKSEVSIEYENDMVLVGKEIFDGYKKVFLGHYHGAQKLNDTVEYIGSTLQLTFNEAYQDKHIIVLDTETLQTEYIKNEFSPKHFILKPDEIDQYELRDNFVNVCIDDISQVDVAELRSKLEDKMDGGWHLISDNKMNKDNVLIQKFDLSEGDLLDRYVNAVECNDLDKQLLLKIGKEICLAN